MKPLIIANWKMNGTRAEWLRWTHAISPVAAQLRLDVVLAPPMTGLCTLKAAMDETNLGIYLAAQNVSSFEGGAHTGEVSAVMLKDTGATYCLIGHSERRAHQNEDDTTCAHKAVLCLRQDIVPVLCIGETAAERNAGQTIAKLSMQLDNLLEPIKLVEPAKLVIAYEPRWAISTAGSSEKPTPQGMHEVFRFLRATMLDKYGEIGYDIRLTYGGSVVPENAADFMQVPEVNGLLVGSASLKPEIFTALLSAVAKGE